VREIFKVDQYSMQLLQKFEVYFLKHPVEFFYCIILFLLYYDALNSEMNYTMMIYVKKLFSLYVHGV